MTNQLTLSLACLGSLLAGACSSSKLPIAAKDGSVAGKGSTGGTTAGSRGIRDEDAGTATGVSGTTGRADGGSAGTGVGGSAGMHAGGSAGTSAGGSAGTRAGGSTGGSAGTADAGMMTNTTCDPAVSSVPMCGTNDCPAVSSSAQACTVNCCTAHGECGTRTATLDGVSPCRTPPTCDPAVSSVSICGTNTCPAVSGAAQTCTVNCCDDMMRCGVRTAVLGNALDKCQVPPTCDSAVSSVSMCGTNMCPPVSSMAPACTINCCDGKMRCGTRTAIMGNSAGGCSAMGNGG